MRAWGPFSSVGPWDQVLFCRWQQDQAVGVILLKVHFLPHGEQPALGPAAPAGRCTYEGWMENNSVCAWKDASSGFPSREWTCLCRDPGPAQLA